MAKKKFHIVWNNSIHPEIYVATRQEIFRMGHYKQGTKQYRKASGSVHGLALLKKQESKLPIYFNNVTAMKWIKQNRTKTLPKKT